MLTGIRWWSFLKKAMRRESKHDYQPTIGDIIRPQIVAGNAPDFICLNDGGEDGVILSLIKDHALLNLDDVFDGEIMLEPVPFAMILQMGSFPVQSVHHTEMMRSIWHHSTVVRRV